MSNWTLKEKSTGELTVTLEGDAWKKAQEKAFDKLAKNVEIDGFRKGQAPKALIEKHVSKNNIMVEAIDDVANTLLQDGLKEHDLEPVARPELKIDAMDETKADLTFIITVKPEVTLGQYQGLEYKEEPVEVTDEEVNAELTRLQEQFAEMLTKEGEAVDGDTVTIDFEGFKDGVAFDGGKAEGHKLVLGSHSFIPGFEEQLVGTKAGDSKDIDLTFPEDYHEESLKGAPVTFKVTVHEVQEKKLPEIDDDFAKDVNAPGVETAEDLKTLIKDRLTSNKKNESENKAMDALITKVVDNASVEIPQAMIDEETNNLVNDFAQRLQQQGFSISQFSQITGQSMDQIKEQMSKDAEGKVKLRLVLEEIAKKENLVPSEEEIDKEYKNIADHYQMEVDKVKELISADALSYDVKNRMAYDLIKDSASK